MLGGLRAWPGPGGGSGVQVTILYCELSTSRGQNYSNARQSKGRANCDRSHANDVSDQGESEFLAYLDTASSSEVKVIETCT